MQELMEYEVERALERAVGVRLCPVEMRDRITSQSHRCKAGISTLFSFDGQLVLRHRQERAGNTMICELTLN